MRRTWHGCRESSPDLLFKRGRKSLKGRREGGAPNDPTEVHKGESEDFLKN